MASQRKEMEIIALLKKTEDLYNKGGRCLYPEPPACCCVHDDPYITIDGKPSACGCGKCPRYRCLDCRLPGNNVPFCTAMKKLEMADL